MYAYRLSRRAIEFDDGVKSPLKPIDQILRIAAHLHEVAWNSLSSITHLDLVQYLVEDLEDCLE